MIVAALARHWTLAELGVMEILLLPPLALCCVWPSWRWYRQGMGWLPVGEAFAICQLFFYVLPCIAGRQDWLGFAAEIRCTAILAVSLFTLAFVLAYATGVGTGRKVKHWQFFERELNSKCIWGLFFIWITYQIAVQVGYIPNLGNFFNVMRASITAAGSIGIANLFFQLGRRELTPQGSSLAVAGLLIGLTFNLLSGFLVESMTVSGLVFLSFILGRKRVPILIMSICALFFGFLHLGKAEFRQNYWEQNSNYSAQRVGLLEGAATWLEASWNALGHSSQMDDSQSLLNRTSLMHVLGQAVQTVPTSQPYLHGATYLMLPELLTPRVFWPAKPRGTLPTETMGIYIGIQTQEGADITGISVGQVAEGWLNFGWLGLAGAGAFLGVLFAFPARLSSSLRPNQVGWMVASVFLVYSTDTAHSIPEIICSLSTALLMASGLLLMISRVPLTSHSAIRTSSRRRKSKNEEIQTS